MVKSEKSKVKSLPLFGVGVKSQKECCTSQDSIECNVINPFNS